MSNSYSILTFKPSDKAAAFDEMMDKITSLKIDGLRAGRPVLEIREELHKVAAEMGWTEELYIEKLKEYHSVCRMEH